MIDTLDHEGIVDILRRAVKQEERHVEFGEQQTMKAIAGRPWLRRRLLGLSLVSMWGVRRLARFMAKRLPKDHPVLSRLPEFLEKTDRLRRAAPAPDRRPRSTARRARSRAPRAALVAEAYAGKLLGGLGRLLAAPFRLLPPFRKRRLTDTYLQDPAVRALPPASPERGAAVREEA